MIRISIANMTCGGCAKGVAAPLRDALPGAEPVVDLARREVAVAGDATVPLAALLPRARPTPAERRWAREALERATKRRGRGQAPFAR